MTSSNEQFKLLPIKYDLTAVNSYTALSVIRKLTASVNMNPEFMIRLCNTLLDRSNANQPTVFGYLPAPITEIAKQVIGTDGYFFKMTTVTCGVDFIWHDRENDMFLFWGGNNFRTVKAMNAIRWRINKCISLSAVNIIEEIPTEKKALADDFDYSDMPELVSCDID